MMKDTSYLLKVFKLQKNIDIMDCPICKKSGLPDYTMNSINCPQCNSDLKGFLLIAKIQQESVKQKRRKKRYYFFIILTTVLILCVLAIIRSNNNIRRERVIIYDSISYYKERLRVSLSEKKDAVIPPLKFTYVIKRGDNLSKIAQYFYNDWTQYKRIEQDNQLGSDHVLMPKDTIYLYLKAE